MKVMRGVRLGPYEITAMLGSGGMAEVYCARDVRLGREVAIKILPDEVASDPEYLARFEREAKTASSLNHPNLVTIYDIGEAEVDGRPLHYMAMELIRGDTLRHHLLHASRESNLRHLAGVADGLAKAHDANVVHRDLKPENIVVSEDDFAKVVDFGLAKHVPGFGDAEHTPKRLTMEGFCVGTLGYMAPEQVRGMSAVDGRADIFSLGCILYEVIAKENPFDDESAIETMHRILHHEPPPLPDAAVDAIVRRCLAKDRSGRYGSMREVAADIRAAIAMPVRGADTLIASRRARQSIASIAVLPFRNESGNEELRFLSDGIPEDVVRYLGRIPNLCVIASSSASRFRDTEDPRQAALELNVDAVLVGRLRATQGVVIVDAELVRAADGTAMWGKKYTRSLTNLVALEQELSRDLANEVRIEIAPESSRDPRPEAYEAYLRGKREVGRETAPALKRGIEYYRQAIELDPDYALPYAALGQVFGRLALLGIAPTRDGVMQLTALARKALALDESLPEAHYDLAVAASLTGDLVEFELRIARVLALNPNFAQAYTESAMALATARRYDEAEAAFRKARELDPLSPRVMSGYAGRLGVIGELDRAMKVLHLALEQFPEYEHLHLYLALAYSLKNRNEEALVEIEHVRADSNPNVMAYRGIVLARTGRTEEARAIADELDEIAKTRYLLAYYRAQLRGELGEWDAAYALLEQGLRDGDYFYGFMHTDPGFTIFRGDPRFEALLKKRTVVSVVDAPPSPALTISG